MSSSGRTLHALPISDPATVARTLGVKWQRSFLPGASDVDGTCEMHSPDGEPDTAAVLSPSDVAALAAALRFVKEADASTLSRRLQGHPAYVDATVRGYPNMDYALLLEVDDSELLSDLVIFSGIADNPASR